MSSITLSACTSVERSSGWSNFLTFNNLNLGRASLTSCHIHTTVNAFTPPPQSTPRYTGIVWSTSFDGVNDIALSNKAWISFASNGFLAPLNHQPSTSFTYCRGGYLRLLSSISYAVIQLAMFCVM